MQRASNPLNDTSEPRLLALRFGPFGSTCAAASCGAMAPPRLQPQPLKVLLLLAGRPGDVVTREEIRPRSGPRAPSSTSSSRSASASARSARRSATTPTLRATSKRCRGAATAGWPAPSSRRRRARSCASGRVRSPPMAPGRSRRSMLRREPSRRRCPRPRRTRGPAARSPSCSSRARACSRWPSCSGGSDRPSRPRRRPSTASRSGAARSTRPASRPTARWSTPRPGTARRASCR